MIFITLRASTKEKENFYRNRKIKHCYWSIQSGGESTGPKTTINNNLKSIPILLVNTAMRAQNF